VCGGLVFFNFICSQVIFFDIVFLISERCNCCDISCGGIAFTYENKNNTKTGLQIRLSDFSIVQSKFKTGKYNFGYKEKQKQL